MLENVREKNIFRDKQNTKKARLMFFNLKVLTER